MPIHQSNRRSIYLRSRAALAAAALASALLGCIASRSAQEPPDDNPPADAYQAFVTRAWPVLESCTACHAGSSAPAFPMPATPREAYTAILDYQPPLVDLADPAASRLLHVHAGVALDAAGADAVLAWIQAEHDAQGQSK